MRSVIEIPDGAKGFDCDFPLSPSMARAARAHGFGFVVRYVRRENPHDRDLSSSELAVILASGLGLYVVQHVESESSWNPTIDKGIRYGQNAASDARLVGLPQGVTVACDLEGVAGGTDPEAVIQYCNRWRDQVAAAGFLPALYVGWHSGLSAEALYKRLRFARYWSSYNLNADERPIVRGVCVEQHVAKSLDYPDGFSGRQIDTDTAKADHLGGRLTILIDEL